LNAGVGNTQATDSGEVAGDVNGSQDVRGP
jgi:hypothetical protein